MKIEIEIEIGFRWSSGLKKSAVPSKAAAKSSLNVARRDIYFSWGESLKIVEIHKYLSQTTSIVKTSQNDSDMHNSWNNLLNDLSFYFTLTSALLDFSQKVCVAF